MTKKGFTLLELLIVIGILAILATAAVLVLNPAELLRQARDSTRVSDLASLNSTLGLYATSYASPDFDFGGATPAIAAGTPFVCGTNKWTTYNHGVTATTSIGGDYATDGASTTLRTTNGLGWIPVNLGAMSGGSPIAVLPIDPSGGANLNYSYACDSTLLLYELNANLESVKFTDVAPDNKENSDGGDNGNIYEVGTKLDF